MEGVTVGSYVVTRLLGKGGMGAVYLAEHALLKRPAALKVLLPALSADEELVDRFFNEARATTSIPDPGIVQIFDFGYHTDGSAYIVMEYLEGETLDVRVEGDGPMPPVQALRITRQVATSLEAAHSRGVIHRDLKLENIFLVSDAAVAGGERAKILDFGIAKLTRSDGSRSRTRTGAIMGTPLYMSPEQCKGAHDVDARSDVYSLGCVLFCMVTGRPPFDYESAGEIIAAHLKEDPPSATSVRPEIPDEWRAEIETVVARCLAKDPKARYQSMAEVALAITEALGDGVSDPRTTAPRLNRRAATPDPVAAQFATPVPHGAAPPSSSLARPTTLSSATGATQPPSASAQFASPPRRKWMVPVISLGVVVAAAVVGVVVMAAGQGTTQTPAQTPAQMQPQPQPEPQPQPQPQPPPQPEPQPPTTTVAQPETAPAVQVTPPVKTVAAPVRPGKKKPSTKPTPKGTHETKPSKQGEGGAGDVDRGD